MTKRRRLLLMVLVPLAAVLLGSQFVRDSGQRSRVGTATTAPSVTKAAGTAGGRSAAGTAGGQPAAGTAGGQPAAGTAGGRPVESTGTFAFTRGYGPVLGRSGTLRRFRVGVETSVDRGAGSGFAAEIDRTLGDPRSWIAGRRFRLQRVPTSAAAEFTIYLATSRTSGTMCAVGGLKTGGYTSCRLPGRVVINLDRWRKAVPRYGASLPAYRAYAINHEVGHQFGYGHEKCPGKGRPAPVMQQQTYGLTGCVANSWPYRAGKRYAGRPVS